MVFLKLTRKKKAEGNIC